jgi:hypothetical protein
VCFRKCPDYKSDLETIRGRVSSLEENVAWLSTVLGGPTALSRAVAKGAGSDLWGFYFLRRTNGDEYVFASYTYPTATTNQQLKVYKNGSLVYTETIADKALATGGMLSMIHGPVVVTPGERVFYLRNNISAGYDITVDLREFDFGGLTGSTVATINGESRQNRTVFVGSAICYDPKTTKIYLCQASSNTLKDYLYPVDVTTSIHEFSSAGVVDHRVLFLEEESSGGADIRKMILGASAYNGIVYFGLFTKYASNSYYSSLNYVSTSSTDASSWTTVRSVSKTGIYYTYQKYLVLQYGLHIDYGSTALYSPDGSTSWDLSSYLDSGTRQISTFRKVDSGENYEILTRKGTTAYLLSLSSGGGVNSISSRAVTSDYAPTYVEWDPQPIEIAREGGYPKLAFVGTSKKFLELVPLTRSVE